MPDLQENAEYWERRYHWRYGGDEWSNWWGTPEAQWGGTIFPRVGRFLPAHCILEIAPGYGRWTQFLRAHCEELIGIDLSAKCVNACRRRFQDDRNLSFYVNDGRSLAAARDRCVDFAFSFDSLVHVDQEVIDAYIGELARVLSADGVAFLHHSNMGAYGPDVGPHWRSGSVSAQTVAQTAAAVGLSCFRQELLRWGDEHDFLNDSFTWMSRAPSTPREPLANHDFMAEARRARLSHITA